MYSVICEQDSAGLMAYTFFSHKDRVYMAMDGVAPSEDAPTLFYPDKISMLEAVGRLMISMNSMGIKVDKPVVLNCETLK